MKVKKLAVVGTAAVVVATIIASIVSNIKENVKVLDLGDCDE